MFVQEQGSRGYINGGIQAYVQWSGRVTSPLQRRVGGCQELTKRICFVVSQVLIVLSALFSINATAVLLSAFIITMVVQGQKISPPSSPKNKLSEFSNKPDANSPPQKKKLDIHHNNVNSFSSAPLFSAQAPNIPSFPQPNSSVSSNQYSSKPVNSSYVLTNANSAPFSSLPLNNSYNEDYAVISVQCNDKPSLAPPKRQGGTPENELFNHLLQNNSLLRKNKSSHMSLPFFRLSKKIEIPDSYNSHEDCFYLDVPTQVRAAMKGVDRRDQIKLEERLIEGSEDKVTGFLIGNKFVALNSKEDAYKELPNVLRLLLKIGISKITWDENNYVYGGSSYSIDDNYAPMVSYRGSNAPVSKQDAHQCVSKI